VNPIELAHGLAAIGQRAHGPPVLAVHGWLDNAGSFLPLSRQFKALDLIAMDWPGHGHSRPRPDGYRYHLDDYVFDLLAVADSLKWPRFHLLGHSMGGAVACLLAAACPERIASLCVIEGLGPISSSPDGIGGQWRKAVERSQPRARRIHASRSDAILARSRNGDLDVDAATILAGRGLIEVPGGYQWGHDLRLTWPTAHHYTETQVLCLLRAIEAPVLSIQSNPPSGLLSARTAGRRLAAVRHARSLDAPGGHHLHLNHAECIAAEIEEFFHAHD